MMRKFQVGFGALFSLLALMPASHAPLLDTRVVLAFWAAVLIAMAVPT